METKYAVGLMSGTSLDGIDAALVKIQGSGIDTTCKLIHFVTLEIPEQLRQRILDASVPETSRIDEICSLNFELGVLYNEATTKVLSESNFKGSLDFVASHGQTLYHLPIPQNHFLKSTLQIGDPSMIAFHHKVPVVFNFRVMDIVAGGDGAPLVPYPEFLIYREKTQTVLLQNIGGIGNVTVIPANAHLDDVFAFDTGPGNMMMNAATAHYYQELYDENGTHARKGLLIDELYQTLINHPYLKIEPPKSTGREMFGERMVSEFYKEGYDPDDVIYTLTKFTAYSITNAYKQYIMPKHTIHKVIIGGGGAYNPVLLEEIRLMLPKEIQVCTQEDLGFSSDAKEAIAFAILGNETLAGKPSNVPSATASNERMILGQICPNPWPTETESN
ncbi:anhydro-N-acetylmuramic acid kinase AnmK [Erysipelothrix piscisicarius]|uniref:anhydro-N-acetylmuramic acid kinase AnmK n=1 Tax=Erysipelothrix piscisicarius TaxID=2485784 RepID=UPI002F953B63